MQNVSENIQKFIWQYAIVFQKYATFIQQSISLLCRLYCSHFFSQLFTLASSWQLSGLVIKVLACCTGGPGFDPWMENPKFSIDIHQQRSKLDIVRRNVEFVIPCTSVYAWQVKDPTHEINVNSLSIITSSNSINLCALLSGKIGLSTIPAW